MKSMMSPSQIVSLGWLLAGVGAGAAGVGIAVMQRPDPVPVDHGAGAGAGGSERAESPAIPRDARVVALDAAALLAEFRRCGGELAGAAELQRFASVTRLRRLLLAANDSSRLAVLLGYEAVPLDERSDVVRALLRELLSTASPRAWLEAVGAGHLGEQPLPAQSTALAALGEGDLGFARAWIQAHLNGSDRLEAFQSLAVSVGRKNFGEGVALLKDSLEASEFSKAVVRLGERVDYDAPGVLEWLHSCPDVDLRLQATRWMLPRWEADKALAWIAAWPEDMRVAMQFPGPDRVIRDAYGQVLGELAQKDPERAWALTASLLPLSRTEARQQILRGWMNRDPVRVVATIGTLESEPEQASAFRYIFQNGYGAKFDNPTMARIFDSLLEKPVVLKGAGQEFFKRWTQSDPAAASAAFSRLPEPGTQAWGNILGEVAQTWARNDPEAAVRWLQTAPEGFYRRSYLGTVFHFYAAENPEGALQLALRLTEPAERANGLQAATEAWAKKDPLAAGAFALSQQSPESRSAALTGVVAAWARSAPENAGAWALHLEDASQRISAIEVLTTEWADPAAASRWMEALPEASAERDTAIKALIPRVVRDDPAGAMYWALRGSTPEVRASLARSVGRTWLEQSPAEAREWLRNRQDLPAEVKAELLGPGGN